MNKIQNRGSGKKETLVSDEKKTFQNRVRTSLPLDLNKNKSLLNKYEPI